VSLPRILPVTLISCLAPGMVNSSVRTSLTNAAPELSSAMPPSLISVLVALNLSCSRTQATLVR
jgi:hypothetical protein